MLKVKVTYNPYFVETKIEINGAMLEDGDTVVQRCGIINSRLQNWVDRFFPVLREEYRENQFELTFKGTAQDAEDFVALGAERLGTSRIVKIVKKEHLI